MPDLTIALIQADLVWEDPEANMRRLGKTIDTLPGGVHVVVLPEMFPTGFSLSPAHLAQKMDGPVVAWMRSVAQARQVDLTGSAIVREDGNFYNRLLWVRPDRSLRWYDKRHLFRYAGEHAHYTPGAKRLTVTCRGWKIRPFICYDLRFPIWTRNLDNAYDLALFVANWPERRADHWRALLKARAIENQCYVAGVNRVGRDGNGLRYRGDSGVIDPRGRVVASASETSACIVETLSAGALADYRAAFPAWMDADGDMLSDRTETKR